MLGSIFSLVGTSLIIILSFKLTILSRITDIAGVLGRVKAGDLTARTSRGISEDEIGDLQLGVNTMVSALEQRIEERKAAEETLKEYSERLEDMVKERTQELQDAQQELVRKEELATLGQLAGGVAHELRNPLGAVKNAAYFLNMVLEEPDPDVKTALEIMDKEIGTSEKIISSLLDFAHSKPPFQRQVDVKHLVHEALSRAAVPDNVAVTTQLDEALPTILADPDQLGQVFDNIILNAIQAMTLPSPPSTSSGRPPSTSSGRPPSTSSGRGTGTPEGGQLNIQTLTSSVEPSLVSSSKWVAVSFSDTGVGIPPENLDKLFEPLFTTKAKGIGLGLALVKGLVEGHGGRIEIKSVQGQGSTFTVKLPKGATGGKAA